MENSLPQSQDSQILQETNQVSPNSGSSAKCKQKIFFLMLILFIILIVLLIYLISGLKTINGEIRLNSLLPKVSPSITVIPAINNVIQIKGSAMEPNFKNGDYYSVDRNYYKLKPIQRGDVVLFTRKQNQYGRLVLYIKRIVGLPDDSFRISSGKVYLNGNHLSEPYLAADTQTIIYPGSFIKDGVDFTIPQDNYLMLGDNRSHSSDSREWGLISKNNILGKILTRIENYIPPTQSPEEEKIEMKYDLIESLTQKMAILKNVKDMCSSLSSYQNPQIICALENELKCNLNEMSIEQLQPLSQLAETAITDCVQHQSEIETKRSK